MSKTDLTPAPFPTREGDVLPNARLPDEGEGFKRLAVSGMALIAFDSLFALLEAVQLAILYLAHKHCAGCHKGLRIYYELEELAYRRLLPIGPGGAT